jgi:hypothetical protein
MDPRIRIHTKMSWIRNTGEMNDLFVALDLPLPAITLACVGEGREYCTIYRGPDFLAVLRFGSTPTPFPISPDNKLSSILQSPCVSPVELTDRRGGEGVGVESKYTTARRNRSIFSALAQGGKGCIGAPLVLAK